MDEFMEGHRMKTRVAAAKRKIVVVTALTDALRHYLEGTLIGCGALTGPLRDYLAFDADELLQSDPGTVNERQIENRFTQLSRAIDELKLRGQTCCVANSEDANAHNEWCPVLVELRKRAGFGVPTGTNPFPPFDDKHKPTAREGLHNGLMASFVNSGDIPNSDPERAVRCSRCGKQESLEPFMWTNFERPGYAYCEACQTAGSIM